VFRVIRTLKRKPPKVPVIYLLGGSAARECTISDRAWAAEVRYIGGHRVRTFNLGSSGQTYAQSTTVVKLLPAVPSVVLIGVNLGRYMPQPVILATRGGEPLTPGAPAAARRARGYEQHQYHVAAILTDAQKRAMVPWWLTHRYPIFKDNFAGNVAELDQLIATCQARGLHPVLVEMPLNQPIIGHAFDEPRKTYRDSGRALAKKYGIPKRLPRQGPAGQRRLLRSLPPGRAGSGQVAAAALQDGGLAARALRHGQALNPPRRESP
jgi:hypothetical protein